MYSDKLTQSIAKAATQVMDEQLKGDQHKIDKNKNNKIDAHDFKKLRSMKKEEIEDLSEMDYGGGKSPYAGHGLSHDDDDDGKKELTAKVAKGGNVVKSALDILNKQYVNKKDVKKEEVDLEEGKMAQLSADLRDLSHADFHKEYGKPKSHFDPTNFKKPVQPGKEMDRAKALAQRGMTSMKKEEVENLEESKTSPEEQHMENIKKKFKYREHGMTPSMADAVNDHVKKHGTSQIYNHFGDADGNYPRWWDHKTRQVKKLTQKTTYVHEEVEELEELSKATLSSYVNKSVNSAREMSGTGSNAENSKKTKRHQGIGKAVDRLTKEQYDLDEATYVVKHDGVADDHADADAKKLFAGKTNVNSHVSKYASSAEKHADMLKTKGFKNVRIQTMNKEQVEELEEMFPGTPEYEKKYGKAPQDMKPGEKKATTKGEMEKTEKGVVHKRKFSEMLEVYGDNGIRGLFEALQDKEELIEEPTNDEFTAELKDATDKSLGKKRAKVGDASVQSVKLQKEETHSSVSVIDYNDVNGVKFSEIDLTERELTDAEMKEREKNVKGMKKGVEGFKERYGKDAKSVMYATATRMAKEK